MSPVSTFGRATWLCIECGWESDPEPPLAHGVAVLDRRTKQYLGYVDAVVFAGGQPTYRIVTYRGLDEVEPLNPEHLT